MIAILDQSTLTSTSDEIGYIALNPEENFDELTYEQFMDRYRILYHTLENTDVNYGSDPSALFKREIVIGNDQSLILYKITDGSTNELTSLEDNKLSLLSSNSIANETAKLISTDNLVIDLTPTDSAFGIEQFICKEQSRAPIFDFRNLENFQIAARLEVSREANYNTTLGFYKILDAEGSVLDPLTGSIISTSSDAYHDVALNDSNKVNFGPTHSESTFYVDDDVDAFFNIDINDFSLIAPYATVIGEGGIERTYFAFDTVNNSNHGSNMSHFKVFGDNVLGVEDSMGGGDNDFDDLLIHLTIENIV